MITSLHSPGGISRARGNPTYGQLLRGTEALAMRLLNTVLILATMLCSSARSQEHSVGFYFVTTDSTALDALVLEETPFLTDRDLITYDWSQHLMAITPEAFSRFPTWTQIPPRGKPFVVIADGIRCYRAAFSNPLSSVGFGGPQIMGMAYNPGAIRIISGAMRYTDRNGVEHEVPDDRANDTLRDALHALGKLGSIDPAVSLSSFIAFPGSSDAVDCPSGKADCPDTYEVAKLNACIAIALDEGAQWPYAPLETVYELFGVSPKDCVLNPGNTSVIAVPADATVAVAFRSSAADDAVALRWYRAVFEFAPDGSLRVSAVSALGHR